MEMRTSQGSAGATIWFCTYGKPNMAHRPLQDQVN